MKAWKRSGYIEKNFSQLYKFSARNNIEEWPVYIAELLEKGFIRKWRTDRNGTTSSWVLEINAVNAYLNS
ncbi:MAG: hypothetical protein JSW30_02615, partial [Dehalococcoidia bacterium]